MDIAALALQRNKYRHLSDEEWLWFLQQSEGRQRTADKLTTFATIEGWWYPVRLSCEQCSSELTARYKARIIQRNGHTETEPSLRSLSPQKGLLTMADMTGGYGVDTFFMSEAFARTDYVEQNAELCRIAGHNFSLTEKPIIVHNTSAEEFLSSLPLREGAGEGSFDLIYIDPARRDSHGGKVFRLQDCTPNMVELLPLLRQHLTPEGRILVKLSPMLDITQAVRDLADMAWEVHVVAVKNEVKEVLLLSLPPKGEGQKTSITAIDLAEPEKAFTYTREEEKDEPVQIVQGALSPCTFLYEPNAAILKAGAYKTPAARFNLRKLDVNTHLYASDTLVSNFPGRIWQIRSPLTPNSSHSSPLTHANVLVRNYPLTPEQLKKKLHLRDGGTDYVIGCRVAGKPTVIRAERLQ